MPQSVATRPVSADHPTPEQFVPGPNRLDGSEPPALEHPALFEAPLQPFPNPVELALPLDPGPLHRLLHPLRNPPPHRGLLIAHPFHQLAIPFDGPLAQFFGPFPHGLGSLDRLPATPLGQLPGPLGHAEPVGAHTELVIAEGHPESQMIPELDPVPVPVAALDEAAPTLGGETRSASGQEYDGQEGEAVTHAALLWVGKAGKASDMYRDAHQPERVAGDTFRLPLPGRSAMFRRSTRAALALVPCLFQEARSQSLPLLDPARTRLITEEISGDAAYAHLRFMTQFHRPRGGDNNLWTVAEYHERKAREYGLEDVRLIKQASTTRPWNATFADLWIDGEAPERIASTIQSAAHLADYSRPADVRAELIDIGTGSAAELAGKDLTGKIVLTSGSLSAAMTEAVGNRGALGVVWYPSPYNPPNGIDGSGVSRPDQIRWVSLSATAVGGKEPTFAFVLSTRQGVALKNRLAAAQAPVRVHALVRSAFASLHGAEPWQVMVEGVLKGTDPLAEQDIVLTAHLQEGPTEANDDASGTSSLLEIGRALTRLVSEGRLPRPRRNIRFWWTTEISSERQYFADHPEEVRRIWVNVNQDMVGADQSLDIGRKQGVTRVPATRFHFFNDVMESVLDYLVAGNTFELAQLVAGSPLYPRPVLSHLGSMFRYNAEAIWFHDQSDHMTFNEAPIGIPGVSFTNMPDRFIHSSDDDLWAIDRTQLQRNAVAVALIAYVMATADAGAAPALLAETIGRGGQRIAANLALGLRWIAAEPDKTAAWALAADQLRYAAERERLAIRSVAQIAPGVAALTEPAALEVDRRELQAQRELDLAWRQATGQRVMPKRGLTAIETQLAALKPVLVGGPREFLTGRGQTPGVPGLHGYMAPEVTNAVDGRRTGLDIYRYVAAEAREAGAHYYGTVTPEAVLKYLQNLAGAGLIGLQ